MSFSGVRATHTLEDLEVAVTTANDAEQFSMRLRYAELTIPDVAVESCPKWVRVYLGGEPVADSRSAVLMHERGHLPVYYFPFEDVRGELLEASDKKYHCPRKGDARFWSIRVGDRFAKDAAWSYPEPIESCPDISGLVAFDWGMMDAWFEEEEEVFVHARDPYKRIDVLESSRHVVVRVDGATLADTRRPVLLLETGLPCRYYLPKRDVRWQHLSPTDTTTQCPYKGVTSSYWSVESDGRRVDDVAWCYDFPLPEVAKIAGRVAFFNERVDLVIDGEPQARPETKWS